MNFIGYDLRVAQSRSAEKMWSHARRMEHLVSVAVDVPLSVDRAVWPSAFDELVPVEAMATRRDFDFEHKFCRCLDCVRFVLHGVNDRVRHTLEIVAVWTERPGGDTCIATPQDYASVEWTLLGFDVADEFFTSALTNCGLGGRLREEEGVSQMMNRNCLFSEFRDAQGFLSVCDTLLPSHSPFSVFKIEKAGPTRGAKGHP